MQTLAAEHFDIFVQEFTNVPNIKDLVCPWVYIPLAQNRSKAPKPQETNEMKGAVRELDCKGNVTAENLVEMGFVANTRVKSKDTGKATKRTPVIDGAEDAKGEVKAKKVKTKKINIEENVGGSTRPKKKMKDA